MVQKTEAAVLFNLNTPLSLTELIIPALQPGQLLVDIAFSGLCHTQLGEVRGRRGPDRFLPHTLGHEGSGVVIEVGEGVTKVKAGDHVVLSWLKGGGKVVPSTTYQSKAGSVNSGAISTFMRSTVTCEACVTPIPNEMPLREAALLGCAVPTGCGIIMNTSSIKQGQSVAIFGMGGIGFSAMLYADMVGASPIIAVDIIHEKLEKTRHMGATHTINASFQDPLSEIYRITENLGVDLAIEAAGHISTMEMAYRAVKVSGGLCVIAGNVEPGQYISIDPYDLIKGKQIKGTWGGETDPDRDIPLYVNFFLKNRLKLDQLISAEYYLEDINTCLEELEQGKIIRGVIDMSS